MNKPDNISLRDWFAGMALSGFCANPNIGSEYDEDLDKIANAALSAADAMLDYVEEDNE